MKSPKFRVECECGAKNPRPVCGSTASKWIQAHTTEHMAPTCKHDFRMGMCIKCRTVEELWKGKKIE